MFDDVDFKESMQFSFCRKNGDTYTHLSKDIDDAAYLGNIITEFADFLRSAGFYYVESVRVLKEGGGTLSSED